MHEIVHSRDKARRKKRVKGAVEPSGLTMENRSPRRANPVVISLKLHGKLDRTSLDGKTDLLPWHLPYSIFEPVPFPLVTLLAGSIIGVLAPLSVALVIQRDWMWCIANLCILAHGTHIATARFSSENYLDTPKLLELGVQAHPDCGILLIDHLIWLRWFSPIICFRVVRTNETGNKEISNLGRIRRCT